MFFGISKTLKKMSGFRLHAGFRMNKWYSIFLLIFLVMFYGAYYAIIGSLWLVYGFFWCIWQLCKLWVKLFKKCTKPWQKITMISVTAVILIILAITGAFSSDKKQSSDFSSTETEFTTESETFTEIDRAIPIFDDEEETEEHTAETHTTTTTTTKPTTTTTTTTKPTTTTTTTKPTTTTTTTKPITTTTTKQTTTQRTTTERTTAPTVVRQQLDHYVLNTNTMKIHRPSCASVDTIDPGNYAETDDYNSAIQNGYVPCKRCFPS